MNLFRHPKQVCMTYFQHAKLSLNFSFIFFKASLEAFIHAIYPDICVTSTSDTIKQINDILNKSGCRDNKPQM